MFVVHSSSSSSVQIQTSALRPQALMSVPSTPRAGGESPQSAVLVLCYADPANIVFLSGGGRRRAAACLLRSGVSRAAVLVVGRVAVCDITGSQGSRRMTMRNRPVCSLVFQRLLRSETNQMRNCRLGSSDPPPEPGRGPVRFRGRAVGGQSDREGSLRQISIL